MKKLYRWCDDYLLKIWALFLVLFIPLYPKLPLIHVVRTWVYIRLEDMFVGIFVFLFLWQWKRGKVNIRTPLTIPIILYWIIGAISTVYSILFIGPHLPYYFPHIILLHFLRRIEYMVIFFIACATIRSIKDLYHVIGVFIVALVGVIVYGVGQRYMGFPAFLTMNEEFAKGIPLFLSATSRISSTFAGHYDLASFLVFSIVLLGSVVFGIKNWLGKIVLILLCVVSLYVLLLTASRVSFAVLGCALLTMLWLHKKQFWIVPIAIVSILLLVSVSSTSERFSKTFRLKQVLFDMDLGRPVAAVTSVDGNKVVKEESKSPGEEDLPIGTGYVNVPVYPPVKLPPVIYLISRSTGANREDTVATSSGNFLLTNALVYDISLTTRIQGEWPKAMEAFGRNIFLGSGYSTLSLAADNDYLRALGETGLLGFLSFFYIFVIFLVYVRSSLAKAPPIVQSVAIGAASGVVGLLLNAVFIDVFEASKVAYVLWFIVGFTVGALQLYQDKTFALWKETKRILMHPLVFGVILLAASFVVFSKSVNNYFVADDFTWAYWAAKSLLKDIPSYFTDATGFFYRPITKLYFLGAFSFFWLKPFGYHVVNVLFHFGATFLVFLLAKVITKKTRIATIVSLFFLVLAVHHENVFWISGISSLGGAFFALFALYLFTKHARAQGVGWMSLLASVVAQIVAMLFYEGMMFMPLVAPLYAWLFGSKKSRWTSLLFIALIPSYWFVRSQAHALYPSGSYGINLRVLPFNIVGNLLGYTLLTIFGPASIPFYEGLRGFMKDAPVMALGILGGVCLLGAYLWKTYMPKRRLSKNTIFWILFTFIALIPYLGLGNIAERYGYVASFSISMLFFEILVGLRLILLPRFGYKATLFILVLGIGSLFTNYQQLQNLAKDWKKAGDTAFKILSTVKSQYSPVVPGTLFVYGQVPTRIGRAWVFPVGLREAHFHLFWDDTIGVEVVGSGKDALEVKARHPATTKALIIEGDNVKEIYN